MAGTRSSSRLAASGSSPSAESQSPKVAAGTKRKPDNSASPKAKRGKKTAEKVQQSIEDTISPQQPRQDDDAEPTTNKGQEGGLSKEQDQDLKEEQANGKELKDFDSAKDTRETDETSKMDDSGSVKAKDAKAADEPQEANGDTAVEPSKRDEITPSSILEKGIIYFFFRGRVGIDEPQDVSDIARSYIVLRPLPHGAKLGEGPIGDAGNCRLLALPKKVLPVSAKDRFMVFVEKSKLSFADLKETFLSASDYATKTAGMRHSPAATPIGEGVYAITTTGRESHLAYILTIPSELSEVQKDVGLCDRGSFVTSAKNPQYPGPANASLPQGPDYPKEIIDEFRSLRWIPLQPKLLDYANAQILLIGELKGGLDKATEPMSKDKKQDKETPLEEMEKLEHEDEIRTDSLKGDDAIFTDLGLSSKEYPKVPTTWYS